MLSKITVLQNRKLVEHELQSWCDNDVTMLNIIRNSCSKQCFEVRDNRESRWLALVVVSLTEDLKYKHITLVITL